MFIVMKKNYHWLYGSLLCIMILPCIACSASNTSTSFQYPQQRSSLKSGALPGLQIWNQGVSSFLFGTNDTQEWSDRNVEVSSAIQQALKDAHFTLMRTFFFDKSLADNHPTTDAEIEQRLATIQHTGMTCLGVLYNIFNADFVRHVVTYAGPRCQLYEFGNEDDYNGVSIDAYLKQWNTLIPILRRINPEAKFIGPVTYSDRGSNNFMEQFLQGVRQSGVLPDAVSFHWYPCYNDTRDSCLAKADSYGQVAQQVRDLVKSTLGKELPVGITEWNYDPNNPPPAYGDESDFITSFTTTALQSMIGVGVAFACQFDAASYSGYGRLDMFDINTDRPKPQYYVLKAFIQHYLPSSENSTRVASR